MTTIISINWIFTEKLNLSGQTNWRRKKSWMEWRPSEIFVHVRPFFPSFPFPSFSLHCSFPGGTNLCQKSTWLFSCFFTPNVTNAASSREMKACESPFLFFEQPFLFLSRFRNNFSTQSLESSDFFTAAWHIFSLSIYPSPSHSEPLFSPLRG